MESEETEEEGLADIIHHLPSPGSVPPAAVNSSLEGFLQSQVRGRACRLCAAMRQSPLRPDAHHAASP